MDKGMVYAAVGFLAQLLLIALIVAGFLGFVDAEKVSPLAWGLGVFILVMYGLIEKMND